MASFPDFICIGAQKAATTWLYEALRWMPGVFLPPIKELHYFSELYSEDAMRFGPKHRTQQISVIRNYHSNKLTLTPHDESIKAQLDKIDTDSPNDDWYRSIFEFANDHQICGEICPCYMNIPVRGVRHVMNINPLMRVLVLVRDPIDRAWSHMRMHTKTGALDFDLESLLTGQTPMGPFMRYTDYANSLERWKSMAGEGRFKAVVYDHIQSDPQSAMDEISRFIGLPHSSSRKKLDEVVFSGKAVELPVELREKLFRDLEPQYDYLNKMFPKQVESWVDRHKAAMAQ